MTVKELIRELQAFDGDLYVGVEAEYDCGMAIAGDTVDGVEFKGGKCVLISNEG